jgi:metal-responsive CopG/Arc/MetJ family transcriptional regulator
MKNSALVTVTLPREILDQVDAAAQKERRTRSNFIRTALERSLTGKDRLAALQAIADTGLEDYAADGNRERRPNATAVIADSCVEGRHRLAALDSIAKGPK